MNSRFFKPPKVTIPFVCASDSMGRRSRNRARNRIRELGTAFSGNELPSESATLCDQCYVEITGTLKDCEFRRRLRRAEHLLLCLKLLATLHLRSSYDVHFKLTKVSHCRNNSPVLLDSFGSRFVSCEDPEVSIAVCALFPGSGPAVTGAGANRSRSRSADSAASGASGRREAA